MSILDQEDEYKVFPCPNCQKIVSTRDDNCRYCGSELSRDIKQEAVRRQVAEIKELDIDRHMTIAGIGAIVFISGLGLLIQSIVALFAGGAFFIWSPIITIIGFGAIIYGLKGIWKEKRSK